MDKVRLVLYAAAMWATTGIIVLAIAALSHAAIRLPWQH